MLKALALTVAAVTDNQADLALINAETVCLCNQRADLYGNRRLYKQGAAVFRFAPLACLNGVTYLVVDLCDVAVILTLYILADRCRAHSYLLGKLNLAYVARS